MKTNKQKRKKPFFIGSRGTDKAVSILQKEYLSSFTVFPDHLNYSGSLFGGKLLAEMDLAASNAVRKALYETSCDGLVTAHLNQVDFKNPGRLGDIVELRSVLVKAGRTSLTVDVQVNKEDRHGTVTEICSARFVFVALRKGKPFPHDIELIVEPEIELIND
ncbi:acyl-CoA thioesterase [bacterium SCSIO 12741]|nr:acyl-CoA thioesterase [bacterium SCSIO 12741]